jgi:hypothetical protein
MKSLFLFALIALLFAQCNKSAGNLVEGSQTTKVDYKAEGFTSATIVWDKTAEAPCNYLIHTKDGQILEAMDLSEDVKEDGTRIWLKWMAQRRPSQCSGAQPVGIQAIVKR